MGTSSSKPSTQTGEEASPSRDYNEDSTSSSLTTTATQRPLPDPREASLSGMALVNHKCRKRKKVYDRCVNQWYSQEFLPGKSVDQQEACGELFENYRTCILKGIRKEIWDKQGLPPPKEGSALDEMDDE